MKKNILIILLALISSFSMHTYAATLSDNDQGLKAHIEQRLSLSHKQILTTFIKKYDKRLQKFSTADRQKINTAVINKIDKKISRLLEKYPQDVAIPKKANDIYLVLEYIKLTLMEKDFEGDTLTGGDTGNNNHIQALNQSTISTTIPSQLGKFYTKHFVKYTSVIAPNGKPIHIVAQDKISDEQILRARGILEHYLRNYPASTYGADKSKVANAMANNNALLALLNGEDNGKNRIGNKVTGQPLYQNEIQTEGGKWYINQNYEHRDAAYEEILHFVHDTGIGVDGKNTLPGALPEYQAEIRKAQKNALSNNIWGKGQENREWIEELAQENSLTQEYLASVIDSYYGLWGAWKEGSGGMRDIYAAKTRENIQQKDPMGYELLNNRFFHPYITYNARIEKEFTGTFSLRFDQTKSYTYHSQYLKDITLLGDKNTNVRINELDNYITGNGGINTVIFSGKENEYNIKKDGIFTIVTDTKNRDGSNTLQNIEHIQFSDNTRKIQ